MILREPAVAVTLVGSGLPSTVQLVVALAGFATTSLFGTVPFGNASVSAMVSGLVRVMVKVLTPFGPRVFG